MHEQEHLKHMLRIFLHAYTNQCQNNEYDFDRNEHKKNIMHRGWWYDMIYNTRNRTYYEILRFKSMATIIYKQIRHAPKLRWRFLQMGINQIIFAYASPFYSWSMFPFVHYNTRTCAHDCGSCTLFIKNFYIGSDIDDSSPMKTVFLLHNTLNVNKNAHFDWARSRSY